MRDGGRSVPWLLGGGVMLAAAAGVPSEEMLQDTLKSAIVAFAALVAAFAFLFAQRERSTPLRWHAVLVLPLMLMLYALGSMAWSHTYLGGVEAVRWFLFTLIAWLALNTLDREDVPVIAWCVHGAAVLASVWAAWQFWGALALFPQGPQPASTFVNRNFFAEFVVCALPFGALLLAQARSTRAALALAASLGFLVTALLMTGTRSALVAAGVLAIVLPLAAWHCRGQLACANWALRRSLLVAAVFVATVLVLGNVRSGNPAILDEGYGATPIARGLHRAEAIGPTDYSLNVRMTMWRATVRAIVDHPFAGLGAGAWEARIPRYQDPGEQLETDYYVHDEFLQLVAEYGLVGWVVLVALLAWLLQAAWRTWQAPDAERPVRAVFLASLLALLVVSTIGFPWRLATTGALFALCVGGLAASESRLARRPVTLRWTPGIAQAALAATTACTVLAGFITVQAARAEYKLVHAARLALAISATGTPDDPRFAAARRELLQLAHEGIAIHPHYRKITPVIADELARWGDWADAVPIWESVLASRPEVVVLLTNAARGHDMLGHREEAFLYLERAREVQPDAPAVRSLEVLMLARAGLEHKAMERAQQALAAGIADYDLVNAAYLLAQRAGDYPQALALLERRMRDWPESRARGLVQKGLLLDQGFHDPQKALAAFRLGLAGASQRERAQLLEQVPSSYLAQLAAPAQTSSSSR